MTLFSDAALLSSARESAKDSKRCKASPQGQGIQNAHGAPFPIMAKSLRIAVAEGSLLSILKVRFSPREWRDNERKTHFLISLLPSSFPSSKTISLA